MKHDFECPTTIFSQVKVIDYVLSQFIFLAKVSVKIENEINRVIFTHMYKYLIVNPVIIIY